MNVGLIPRLHLTTEYGRMGDEAELEWTSRAALCYVVSAIHSCRSSMHLIMSNDTFNANTCSNCT